MYKIIYNLDTPKFSNEDKELIINIYKQYYYTF